MWAQIDAIVAQAPHVRALRFHKVALLEARRRRAAGLDPLPELGPDETTAAFSELAVPALLSRCRDAYDGRIVLVKGPEVALDYPAPGTRPFGDLDLLVDDAPAAQAALLAAGFREVGDPSLYDDIHHLRPLAWRGLPLVIELHSRLKWPESIPGPETAALLADAIPTRLGIAGIETLAPAQHALVLAAHSWAHEPLGRLGHMIDIAAVAARAGDGEVEALAREWRCRRLWRCTESAGALFHDGSHSAALALWGRHLTAARERTVFENHLHRWASPLWGAPRRRTVTGLAGALAHELRLDGDEPWRQKFGRSRMAIANARVARDEHDRALEARGYAARERTETT
jgi:Uncharacterised nucleotidyltransferase